MSETKKEEHAPDAAAKDDVDMKVEDKKETKHEQDLYAADEGDSENAANRRVSN